MTFNYSIDLQREKAKRTLKSDISKQDLQPTYTCIALIQVMILKNSTTVLKRFTFFDSTLLKIVLENHFSPTVLLLVSECPIQCNN